MSAYKTFLPEFGLRPHYRGIPANSCQTVAQIPTAAELAEHWAECAVCGDAWASATGTISVIGPVCLKCTKLFVELEEYC